MMKYISRPTRLQLSISSARFFSAYKAQAESVRNKEIEFYSNLDDWWGPKSKQGQLHKFNKVRVNYIRKMILSD